MKKKNYDYFLNKRFKNWNSDKYNWDHGCLNLPKYCSDYFEIWWTPNKFNWVNEPECLTKYCKKYKHIWWKDYVIWKLSNESLHL